MRKLYTKMSRVMLAVLWVVCLQAAFAQERSVSGTVKDENGAPMPGVSVLVVGTSTGTITDTSGKYSINVGSGAKLLFAFVGYESLTLDVGSASTLDVSMKVNIETLSEVVVTGYAAQKRRI